MSTFKKTKVVLLTTNEKASLKLGQNGLLVNNTLGYDSHFTNQHLYFLSDEEIKEGDWVYNGTAIWQVKSYYGFQPITKKIIATTDKSLSFTWRDNKNDLHIYHLPQPSQSFIEKFVEEHNKGNVITEVLVEYEYSYRKNIDGENIGFKVHEPLMLKVNSKDNTITIRKAKDSWSREEVIELLHRRMEYTFGEDYDKSTTDKWIEENL